MAEYIDKKPFLDKLLYMGYFDDDDEIKEVADSFTVADVIERSKIDKAVEEIEILQKYEFRRFSEDTMYHKALTKCLEILKRNIGE